MGAEIGNSTQKLHARGPIGLRELCAFKYLVEGDGQVRPDGRRPRRRAHRHPRRHLQPAPPRPPGLRPGGDLQLALRPGRPDSGRDAAHKPVDDEPGAEHRLEMCRLAAAGRRGCASRDSRSIGRDRPTRSIPLRSCNAQRPDNELFFILGGDVAAGLPRLAGAREGPVARNAGRGRAAGDRAGRRSMRRSPSWRAASGPLLHDAAMDVSSTCVGAASRAGRPIRYLVPDAVAGYIASIELYGGERIADDPRAARGRDRRPTPPTTRRSTSSSSTCAGSSATPTTS